MLLVIKLQSMEKSILIVKMLLMVRQHLLIKDIMKPHRIQQMQQQQTQLMRIVQQLPQLRVQQFL